MSKIISNPVGWFEIYVEDMSRATKFYEAVFNVQLEKLLMPGIEMMTFSLSDKGTGASGALVKMEGFKPGVGGTLVYFSSEDCALELARIVAAGGVIQQAKTSIGEHGFIALALDTEGNMFGIHSSK